MRTPYAQPAGYASRSVAAMLAAVSFGFLAGALATDIAYWRSANMMWANFSAWLIVAGLAVGGLAVLGGLVSLFLPRSAGLRGAIWLRLLSLVVVLAIALLNAFVHSRDAWTSVVPLGLSLSAAAVAIILLTAWMGRPVVSRFPDGELQ